MKRFAATLAALALAIGGCAKHESATPALWEVSGPGGAHGYLFGTIHALGDSVEWRSAAFEQAFAKSDTLVVEAAGLADREASARIWTLLATTPNLPPLSQRVPREDGAALKATLARLHFGESQFASTESWAAALTLANALQADKGEGVDLALLGDAQGKHIEELEGVAGQLSIFDRLPPAVQDKLLGAVAESAVADPDSDARLAKLWRAGDIDAIAAETHKGMLADPSLREALLVGRNRAWAALIDTRLHAGERVFVAVGTAHLAGPDGLPALLAARGYTVTRIQ